MKKSTSPPWIDADIIHLSNKKNTLWRKVKRFGTVFLKDKLRKLTNKLKNLVEYRYYNYICDVSSDIYKNPKRFWSVFLYKAKSRTLPMTLIGLGEEAVSPVDKANLFNRYFLSVFNQGVFPPLSPENANNDNSHLNSIQIFISLVRDVLLGLDVTKAVGPDSLSPRILRECAITLTLQHF